MEQVEHSPAPWRSTAGGRVIIDRDERRIASVADWSYRAVEGERQSAVPLPRGANASLIETAPHLLALCRRCRDALALFHLAHPECLVEGLIRELDAAVRTAGPGRREAAG